VKWDANGQLGEVLGRYMIQETGVTKYAKFYRYYDVGVSATAGSGTLVGVVVAVGAVVGMGLEVGSVVDIGVEVGSVVDVGAIAVGVLV
jgi:hypothetical protein